MLNMRLARPALLVDLNRIPELRGIERTNGTLRIGAMTRQHAVEVDGRAAAVPLLVEAIRHIAHLPIRTRGTVGGSIAHADPAAELPATVGVLGARMVLRSRAGTRSIPAEEFFVGPLMTSREPDEILEAIETPVPASRSGWAFREVARTHGAFALVGVATTVTVAGDGSVEAIRLGVLGVGGLPYLPDWVGELASGEDPTDSLFAEIGVRVGHAVGSQGNSAERRLPQRGRGNADRARTASGHTTSIGGSRRMSTCQISITVNGQTVRCEAEPRQHLADVLRDRLALRGTHLGCEHGVCGACTVLLDGEPVRSCLLLAVQADGAEVTTVEGLAQAGQVHPLQRAFRDHHALQCGFCTPGMLITALYVVAQNPEIEDELEIREALSGNLCRCTGYQNIVDAVRDAAVEMRAGAGEG